MRRAGVSKILCILVVLACSGACVGLQVKQGPPADRPEVPIPAVFRSEEPPDLEPCPYPGLQRAPSLGPNIYFQESENLWYRRAYRRWYQAFRWNGNWFVLMETPAILADVPIEKVRLPTLEDLEELPPLPPVPDRPGSAADDDEPF